jgi:hypothetical protein
MRMRTGAPLYRDVSAIIFVSDCTDVKKWVMLKPRLRKKDLAPLFGD